MGDETRNRSMQAMKPSDEWAREVARELDRDADFWSDHKVSAIGRALFNARQEGYDAALADVAERLDLLAKKWEGEFEDTAEEGEAHDIAMAYAAELRECAKEGL